MADELRVYPDCPHGGIFTGWYLQRRKRYFLLFHKWKNIARYNNYYYALMMKVLFVPERQNTKRRDDEK